MINATVASRETHTVSVMVPAEQKFVGVVRLVVGSAAASAGLGEEEIADLKVAVSEACTNAVLHAYDSPSSQAERTIEIQLLLGDGVIEVGVSDKGDGVKLRPHCRELNFEEGGFGLTLIGCLMDSVELTEYPGEGTRLKFVKRRLAA